ncbi:MAG: hypothetical protein IKX41_03150, partial [Oscillospiraceae bacterium]|nr:hypothetical protein [Oscillospiraceae bacterium]
MKRILTFVLAAALVLSLAACAKTPGAEPPEKLYVLTHQREAVYLVGADGAEKVYDLPGPMMTADVCGSVLWYVEGDSLVRVGLADGSKTEYALPENEGGGYYMFAAENEAYVALANGQYDNLHTGEIYRAGEDDAYVDIADGQYDNLYTGEIYRVGANGAEQVTHGYAYYMTTCPFTVDGGSVYFLAGGVPAGSELKLVREDADGTRVEFERPGFPLFALSVDGGRVYACWAYDCRSYDAATGGD